MPTPSFLDAIKSDEANIDAKGCEDRRNLSYIFFPLFVVGVLLLKSVQIFDVPVKRFKSVVFDSSCFP